METPSKKEFQIGWICALPIEAAAAIQMLDENFGILQEQERSDTNTYTLGRIGRHHVVIACLPDGQYGTTSATTVAINMMRTFSDSLRIGLMVGIGGGAPSAKHDIRLGDIVISRPEGSHGGVIQHDMRKINKDGKVHLIGSLNSPPKPMLNALAQMRAAELYDDPQYPRYLQEAIGRNTRTRKNFSRPDDKFDRLFKQEHEHLDDATSCDLCPVIWEEDRFAREDSDPHTHYGTIASGNTLIKNGKIREAIRKETGALCFEMEAAGLMADFPCLVIRGICDYADSHKNKQWQGYAALAAAAFTKELLGYVPKGVSQESLVADICQQQITTILSTVKEIRKDTHSTDATVKKLSQRGDDQEFQIIMNWLTPVNYALQQSDLIARRQEGTGEWLLKSNQFQQWLAQSNQTLFCPGMPGAGKTILTSIVIRYLHDNFGNDPAVGIAYLYCNFRQQHEQKSADLVVSLLKHLAQAQPSIPKAVKNLYNLHKAQQTRPSPDEIRNTLHQIAVAYSRTFIIVDALDECQISHEGREAFLREIFSLQARVGINIFATSRYIQDIEAKFDQSIRLEIRASHTDVEKYLDQKLQDFPSWILKDSSLQTEIKSKIARAVDGMFLLAQLYVDSLARKTTAKAIRIALGELEVLPEAPNDRPKTLDRAYLEAMERIQVQTPEHRELAMQALSWISCAKRRLTSAELQHALAVEAKESHLDPENMADLGFVVSMCAGLITFDKESDVVRLVHYTTQEYFERNWATWFPNAHTDITEKCVTYLSFQDFEAGCTTTKHDLVERFESHILYHYAAQNWGYHAVESSIEGGELILDLLKTKSIVSACSQAMLYDGYGRSFETEMTGMHLAAYFGLSKATSALLEISPDADAKDYFGRTPLSWAAENGHEAVVKMLLDKNADIGSKTKYGQTPLSRAAKNGHKAVVKLLLDKNADVEVIDNIGRTPVSWAAENGHEAVVKLLLDKNANIKAIGNYDQTPLLQAAENGHEAVVKLLLDKNADVNWRSYVFNHTPLSQAASNGHEVVVKLLLDKNADVEATDGFGQTPLLPAAKNGHEAVVKLLLDENADVEAMDDYGQTPLLWAAENGHEAVVKLLLEKNASVDSKDYGFGQTPLSWAAKNGHEAVVKLLLNKNADVDSKDKHGQTPLSWAAEKGHEAVVKLLLDKNADVESTDGLGGQTPLSRAAKNGHEAVVKLLLDENADVDSKDKHGQTPLLWAAKYGHEAVVKLLLEKNAGVDLKDYGFGQTPLSWAAKYGYKAVVKLLLNKNADVDSKDEHGQTPLSWAAEKGHEAVVKLLLDKNADVKATDGFGHTALSWAAENGHEAVVKLLLEKNAGVDLKDGGHGQISD